MPNVLKDVTASAATLAIIAPAIAPRAREEVCDRVPRQPDEAGLVRLAQRGDGEAYAELVRRHQRRVFSLAISILRRHEDAEDVAQQVFLKAYVSLPRFDCRSALSTWLYKITANECWDHLRRRRSRPQLLEAELSEAQAYAVENVSTVEGATGPAERVALRQQVENLLAQLGEQDRQMLILREVEGFSVKEVSEILGVNVNTVKVRLFRARARLAQFRESGQRGSSRGGVRGSAPKAERPQS
jgi:RNA polymerase sigma-70 factor (ECF subfamily)